MSLVHLSLLIRFCYWYVCLLCGDILVSFLWFLQILLLVWGLLLLFALIQFRSPGPFFWGQFFYSLLLDMLLSVCFCLPGTFLLLFVISWCHLSLSIFGFCGVLPSLWIRWSPWFWVSQSTISCSFISSFPSSTDPLCPLFRLVAILTSSLSCFIFSLFLSTS